MFAGKKSAQIREILISESTWEEMTCLFAPSLVPCGFMLLAFVIIWFYPLTDKKFKEIVVEIDNRKKVQQQLISDITN